MAARRRLSIPTAAVQRALSAVPGRAVERVTSAGGPLTRFSGRTRAGSAALAATLSTLARPPRARAASHTSWTLDDLADVAGRPREDVERWASSGLLGEPDPGEAGTWDRRARDRVMLLAFATDQGIEETALAEAAAGDRLALLVFERVLFSDGSLTGLAVADRAGVDVDFAAGVWRAIGAPAGDLEQTTFTRRDVEALRVLGAMRTVFTDEDLVEAASVLGRAMSEVSAAAVELFRRRIAEAFIEAGAGELEVALRLAAMSRLLIPALSPLLESVLALHIRTRAQEEAAVRVQDAAGESGQRALAVGFVDIVGFTSLSENLTPLEVAAMATRLVRCAESAFEPHGARIVKGIGDAVMFTTPTLVAGAAAALDLIEAAAESGTLPPLRAGVAHGPVLHAYADYFGRTVNIASRLCEAAGEGTVLVAGDRMPEPAAWEAASLHAGSVAAPDLRGVSEPVEVLGVRRSG